MSVQVGDSVAWEYYWGRLAGTVRALLTSPDHPDVSYHFAASEDDPWALIELADRPGAFMATAVTALFVTQHVEPDPVPDPPPAKKASKTPEAPATPAAPDTDQTAELEVDPVGDPARQGDGDPSAPQPDPDEGHTITEQNP